MPGMDTIRPVYEYERHGGRRGKRRGFDDEDASFDIDMSAILERHGGGSGQEKPDPVASGQETDNASGAARSRAEGILETVKSAEGRDEDFMVAVREAMKLGIVVEKNGSLFPGEGFEEEGGRIILAMRANEGLASQKEEKPEKKKHEVLRDKQEIGNFKSRVLEGIKRVKAGDVEAGKEILEELVRTGFLRETKTGYEPTNRDASYAKRALEAYDRIISSRKADEKGETASPQKTEERPKAAEPEPRAKKEASPKEDKEEPSKQAETEKPKTAEEKRLEEKRAAVLAEKVPAEEVKQRFEEHIARINEEIKELETKLYGASDEEAKKISKRVADLITEEVKLKYEHSEELKAEGQIEATASERDLAAEEALQGLRGKGKNSGENQLLADIFASTDINQLLAEGYEYIDDEFRTLLAAAVRGTNGEPDIVIENGKFVPKTPEGVRISLELEGKIIDRVVEKAFSGGDKVLSSEEKYASISNPETSLLERIKLSGDRKVIARLKNAILNGRVEFRADGTIEPLNEEGGGELRDIYSEIQQSATEEFIAEAFEAAKRGWKETDRYRYEAKRYIAMEMQNERLYEAQYSKEEMKAKKALLGRGAAYLAEQQYERYLAKAKDRREVLEAALGKYEEVMLEKVLKKEALLRAGLVRLSTESTVDQVDVDEYIELYDDSEDLTRYHRQNFPQATRLREALKIVMEEASKRDPEKKISVEMEELGFGSDKRFGLSIDERPVPTLTELYEDIPEAERKEILKEIQSELLADIEANLDTELSDEERRTILETSYASDYIFTMMYERGAIDRIAEESELKNKILDLKTIRVLLRDVRKSETGRRAHFEKVFLEAIAITGRHQVEGELRRLAAREGRGENFDINSDEAYRRLFGEATSLFEDIKPEADKTNQSEGAGTGGGEFDADIGSAILRSNDTWSNYSSAVERQSSAKRKKNRGKGILSLLGLGWLVGRKS